MIIEDVHLFFLQTINIYNTAHGLKIAGPNSFVCMKTENPSKSIKIRYLVKGEDTETLFFYSSYYV